METCRICLSADSPFYYSSKGDAQLNGLVWTFLGISFQDEDESTEKVCSDCFDKLKSVQQLKDQCNSVDNRLLNISQQLHLLNDNKFDEEEILFKLTQIIKEYLKCNKFTSIEINPSNCQLVIHTKPAVKLEVFESEEFDPIFESIFEISVLKNEDDQTLEQTEEQDASDQMNEEQTSASEFSALESESDESDFMPKKRSKIKESETDDSICEPKAKKKKVQNVCCKICNLVIKRHVVENHMNIHKSFNFLYENKHLKFDECLECHMVFNLSENLLKHQKNHPMNRPEPNSCGECQSSFQTERELKDHVFIHHLTKIECPVQSCKLLCETHRSFYFHIQQKHPHFLQVNDLVYYCDFCNITFSSHMELLHHRNDKPTTCKGNLFECDKCGLKFGNGKSLVRHITKNACLLLPKTKVNNKRKRRAANEEEKSYTFKKYFADELMCRVCSKKFKNIPNLKKHCRRCCPDSEFLKMNRCGKVYLTCPSCNKMTKCTSEENLKKHMESCRKNFKCAECPKTFQSRNDLKKHCRICCPESEIFKNERYKDTSKNPRCLFCFKKFNGDNADLFQHHLNMHVAFKFLLKKDLLQLENCLSCNRVFFDANDLTSHDCPGVPLKKGLYSCLDCNEEYAELDLMKEHQFFKHQTFFKCPLDTCRSDYKTYGIYYYHLITTHPNFIEPIKEFPCNYCGEIFGMYPDLVKHRKTLNACKGKKFNCNHCEKVFGTALLLKVHLRQIANPAICEECGKTCVNTFDLSLHKKTHTSARNFKCHVCDRFFVTASGRAAHQKCHIQDKNYFCDQCDYAGQSSKNLKKHKQTVHSGKYGCPVCKNIFSSCTACALHLKKSHEFSPEDIKKIRGSLKISD